MKKIATLFARDPENRRHVINEVTPGCEWVIEGEGIATRKWDGTCCMVRDGTLYRRHEVKAGKQRPEGFEPVDYDYVTGKGVGWVPVGDGPEDRIHRDTLDMYVRLCDDDPDVFAQYLPNGTYELVGPKINGNPEGLGTINGNPEGLGTHLLIPHGDDYFPLSPRDFEGLREWMSVAVVEGLVWWHEDGRRAKLKRRDFD